MGSNSTILTNNTISIEKLNGTNYLLWKMKVWVMSLKIDLIGIIDGTNVDLGPTNVTLQSVWKLHEGKIPIDVLLSYCDNLKLQDNSKFIYTWTKQCIENEESYFNWKCM